MKYQLELIWRFAGGVETRVQEDFESELQAEDRFKEIYRASHVDAKRRRGPVFVSASLVDPDGNVVSDSELRRRSRLVD